MSLSQRESYESAMEAYVDDFYNKHMLLSYDADDAYNDWLANKAAEEAAEIALAIENNNNKKGSKRL